MSNIEKYNNIFIETFNVDLNSLTDDFTYRSVPVWDSVAHMVLITAIEDTFDIMLDTNDILNFTSYNEGKKILVKYNIEL
jgi:acyl carrier protein